MIGLPWGTSCSLFMADLALFMFKLEYCIEQVSKFKLWRDDRGQHSINKTTKLDVLNKLAHCTRYIDDLWNPLVDKETFQIIVKEIYPEWLQLGLEHEGGSVKYLDILIWHTQRSNLQWHSKLYDKKVELIAKGLNLNKFPDPSSKLLT